MTTTPLKPATSTWYATLAGLVLVALTTTSGWATETIDGEVPDVIRPLVASLTAVESAPPSMDLELILRIEATVDLPEVTIDWAVPRQLAIVHGSVHSDLDGLAIGESVELRLVVRPLSDETQEIVVGVVSHLGHGNTVAASAVHTLEPGAEHHFDENP